MFVLKRKRIVNLVVAFILDAIILAAAQIFTLSSFPQETQLLAFKLFIPLLGIFAGIIGSFLLIQRISTDSFFYSWSGFTGLINVYSLIVTILAVVKAGGSISNLYFSFLAITLDLLMVYGAFLAVHMTIKLFK